MQLLTNVVKNPNQRAQFTDPAAMQTICERVILPNLQLRGAHWHFAARRARKERGR